MFEYNTEYLGLYFVFLISSYVDSALAFLL